LRGPAKERIWLPMGGESGKRWRSIKPPLTSVKKERPTLPGKKTTLLQDPNPWGNKVCLEPCNGEK